LLNILTRSKLLNQHDLANQFHEWPLQTKVDVFAFVQSDQLWAHTVGGDIRNCCAAL